MKKTKIENKMLDSLIQLGHLLKTAFQDSKNVQQLSLTHVTKTFVVILAAVLLLIEFTIQNTTSNYILVSVGIPNIISQLPLCICSCLTQSAQIQACCVWYNSVPFVNELLSWCAAPESGWRQILVDIGDERYVLCEDDVEVSPLTSGYNLWLLSLMM